MICLVEKQSIGWRNAFVTNTKISIEQWKRLFGALRSHHPILRTTFPKRDKEPIQQVHQNQELDFLLLDASTWSEDELKAKVIEADQILFDLERELVVGVR